MKLKLFRRFAAFAAAVALLVTASAGSGPAALAGGDSGAQGIARAIAAQEAHTDALLTRAGVTGTAVGLGDGGEPVVLILTDQRGVRGLPSQLDGVTAVAYFTGPIVAHRNPCSGPPADRPDECSGDVTDPPLDQEPGDATRLNPAGVGSSTGSERLIVSGGKLWCTVGTLAGPVNDGVNTFALSNAHIYALEGSTPDGSVQTGSDGDRMLSPGRVDLNPPEVGGCGFPEQIAAADLAELSDFQRIKFGGRGANKIDAAIAMAPDAHLTMNLALDDGSGALSGTIIEDVTLGLPVKKLGRTTLWTTGNVTGVNVTVRIRYDNGLAKFSNQILVEGDSGSFSSGGDSGSLIMTESGNQPVALLFAGSPAVTIANPIDAVLSHFGVTFGVLP